MTSLRKVPEPLKNALGGAVGALDPRCRFDRLVLILGHMRSGSTALANVMCAHPEVSGYGEAHVRYDGRRALGRLVLNQARRRGLKVRARYLFDKVLHDAYDEAAPPEMFEAAAIFLARPPAASIRSIVNLAERVGLKDWRTAPEAADYYEARLARLLTLHERFPAARRIALTHATLTGEPEGALARVGRMLALERPLANAYGTTASASLSGAGDPLQSARHGRIVGAQAATSIGADAAEPPLAPARLEALDRLFAEFAALADAR